MKYNFKTVLFDLDGTLCNTAPDIVISTNQTLAFFGFEPLEYTVVAGFIGDGIETLVRRAIEYASSEKSCDQQLLSQAVKKYRTIYDRNLLHTTHPYPGVTATLAVLNDYRLSVISNKAYYFTRRILDHFKMTSYFDCILGGDSLTTRKPNPEPLKFILQQFDCPSHQALFVGDSEKDLIAARQIEMPVCLVSYGMRTATELTVLNPDFLIDEFADLREILG